MTSLACGGSSATARPHHLASTWRDSASVSRLAVNSRAPNQAPMEVSRVVMTARAWRLGEEGLDIGGAPDVIHDDERRLFAQQVAVLGKASSFAVVAAEKAVEAGNALDARGKVEL